ncbi:MAG: hypothetical protein HLX46_02620 [Corynebacterium sp.]|uniref:hypothetical protein n=1 Tax=Corynebacterium sp. TaxID=1720 RepID=UPI0017FE27EA|nr:hypothetical protein [Corynebacterium sp.]NWO15744.1 hypothetical protein [Corynebacterium sp.]
MTDIIANAQKLLDGTTPGPWKFEERTGYEYPAGPEWGPMMTELEHSVQDKDGYHLFGAYNDHRMIEAPGNLPLAAAAPELAQALAEETYEYIAEWCDHGVWAPIEMEMFDGTFPNLQAARGYIKVAKTRGTYEDTRIVRRRVSPPEVIND